MTSTRRSTDSIEKPDASAARAPVSARHVQMRCEACGASGLSEARRAVPGLADLPQPVIAEPTNSGLRAAKSVWMFTSAHASAIAREEANAVAASHGTLNIVSTFESLTPEQRAWLVEDEKRWQRAYGIAERNPGIDAGGVYRVLRNLEKPPAQRLRAAMIHGRLFSSKQR